MTASRRRSRDELTRREEVAVRSREEVRSSHEGEEVRRTVIGRRQVEAVLLVLLALRDHHAHVHLVLDREGSFASVRPEKGCQNQKSSLYLLPRLTFKLRPRKLLSLSTSA